MSSLKENGGEVIADNVHIYSQGAAGEGGFIIINPVLPNLSFSNCTIIVMEALSCTHRYAESGFLWFD
jgi:hypothetical protein